MSAVIVIPTYNEKENLEALIKGIFAQNLPGLSIVVVDDNSPDGTGELADSLSRYHSLKVIHRPRKEGIGRAYAEAFRKILAMPENPQFILQMDADLSHDPKELKNFLKAAQNYDVILGSRYVSGGKILNWDFFRRTISRFGNFYARTVLGLPYLDLTSGYKCFHRQVLEAMDFDSLNSVGYNFQIETTYRAHKNGFEIIEIPICFTERKSGVSKFNFGIILESFFRVLLLKVYAQ